MRAAFLVGAERRRVRRSSRPCGGCGRKTKWWPRIKEGLRLGPCCANKYLGPGHPDLRAC